MQASYRDAVIQEKLRPASGPSIETQQTEKGKDLTFTASFDVYPEFDLCDLSKLEVVVPVSEVEETNVEETIDRMRKQRVQWEETDGSAKSGQRIVIDFVGKIRWRRI